jgi:putative nucleotidyltransferase with HDIG domain
MTDTPAKTRILFVDDEPLVLQGLQRMLRPMRNEWEMAFVESGRRALEEMATLPFQVVVSDMRMPGMNGAQLLLQVQELYPRTVRLILSGHADKDLIMKCVGTAHQFLAKPCEPEALRTAIARASAFNSSVKSERMKQLIAQMDCLPSIPSLLNEIVEKLQDENCSLEEVGNIISKDLAMAAKLLKLVNSAFFGLRRQISDPSDAATYLGLDIIKALVLAVHAFSSFEGRKTGPISLETLWTHSLEVASLAKRIAQSAGAPKAIVDESFVAGMLHDIGKLALASNLPDEYAKIFELSKGKGLPLPAAEEMILGANHADVGGYLLSLWGLPPGVVDAINYHHDPERGSLDGFTPMTSVHVADALVREAELSGDDGAQNPDTLVNMNYLEAAGLVESLPEWKELAEAAE